MNLIINGEQIEVAENPPRVLLWVLRDELGLIGTKFGCGVGICGACTVHLDGEATRACVTPLSTLTDGADIRTSESLAEMDENGELQLHPVQAAFLAEQVPQCSWCMSGQMMTAVAFLKKNPAPTEAEIIEAMGQNYCRCGCYVRIKSAVAQAANQMTTAGAAS